MKKYVKVAILENEIEAQILSSILIQHNIPHIIRSYHDLAYVGLFQAHKGWGCVTAPSPYQQEIKEILGELRKER